MADDVRTLLHDQAARPSEPIDVNDVWNRGRRRRRRDQAVAAAATLGVTAALLGVVPSILADGPDRPDIVASPTPEAGDLPDGWRAAESFGIRLSIPDGWNVARTSSCWAAPTEPTLIIVTEPLDGCSPDTPAAAPQFVVLEPLSYPMTPLSQGRRLGEFHLSTSEEPLDTGQWVRTASFEAGGQSLRLTLFSTTRNLGETNDILMSLRPADAPSCLPPSCAPPETDPAMTRFEIESQSGRFVAVRGVNETDQQLEGGAAWNLQRWNGEAWQRYDVGGSTQVAIAVFLPGRDPATGTAGHGVPIRTELPPVAGWYRIAKTMSGKLLLSPPLPVEPAGSPP